MLNCHMWRKLAVWIQYGSLDLLNSLKVAYQGQRSSEVKWKIDPYTKWEQVTYPTGVGSRATVNFIWGQVIRLPESTKFGSV